MFVCSNDSGHIFTLNHFESNINEGRWGKIKMELEGEGGGGMG